MLYQKGHVPQNLPIIQIPVYHQFVCMHLLFLLFLILIISQYLHAGRLLAQSPDGAFNSSVGKISFKVHKKPIFPRPVFDRSGLNLGKVQVIEDKVGQHLIQRSALMWKLKADTDLVRVF